VNVVIGDRMKIWNLAYSITNKCNLQCKHCYANSGMPLKNELDLEEIRCRIICEAEKVGTKFITLTGGEPFTQPDIFSVIEEIKNRNIRVCVATNGLLLDDDVIIRLKELHVDRVQVSLESNCEDINDKIRGKGVFKKITSQVIPKLKEYGLFVAVSMTPAMHNYLDLSGMAKLCYGLGVDSLSVRRFSFEGRSRDNIKVMQNEENRMLLNNVVKLRREYRGKMNVSTGDPLCVLVDDEYQSYFDKNVFGGCTAGVSSLAIDAQGNIKPCTRSELIIGNVRTDNMSDVWESNDVLMKLRNRNLLKGKCGSCRYKMICGGCRVAASEYGGSIMDSDPNCWL